LSAINVLQRWKSFAHKYSFEYEITTRDENAPLIRVEIRKIYVTGAFQEEGAFENALLNQCELEIKDQQSNGSVFVLTIGMHEI